MDKTKKNNKTIDKGGNLIPFKKGESGNPAGRPKGARSRKSIVERWITIEQSVANPITGKTESLSQEDIMVLALISKARKGDLGAYRELMDSVYGKLMDNISITPVDKIETTEVVVIRKK